MAQEKLDFLDVFNSLPLPGKEMLTGMAHISTTTGGTKELILATLDIADDEFDKTIKDLVARGLVQRGNSPVDPETHLPKFIEDKKGNRYRLRPDVKADFFEKVLHLPFDKNNPTF